MRQPERPATRPAEVPAAGRYRLDPGGSSAAFRTRRLFGLAAVAGTVRVASGEIELTIAAERA